MGDSMVTVHEVTVLEYYVCKDDNNALTFIVELQKYNWDISKILHQSPPEIFGEIQPSMK